MQKIVVHTPFHSVYVPIELTINGAIMLHYTHQPCGCEIIASSHICRADFTKVQIYGVLASKNALLGKKKASKNTESTYAVVCRGDREKSPQGAG
jgi:hypothetical protein